jgi:hypothetical protein
MSASSHVLLVSATRRPFSETPQLPEGAFYDDPSGLWRLPSGDVLVRDAKFGPRQTKKCDQETGEDQKGE